MAKTHAPRREKLKVSVLVGDVFVMALIIALWGGSGNHVQAQVSPLEMPFWRVSDEPGTAQVVSVELGPQAQELYKGAHYLLFTSAVVPDSVEHQAVKQVSMPITVAVSDTLTLNSGFGRPSTLPRPEWSGDLRVWFKADPSNEPVLQCSKVRGTIWLAADGFWLGGMGVACFCLSDAVPLGKLNGVSAAVESSRNVSVSWPTLANADAQGVIVWGRAPVGEDLLGTIQIVGEPLPGDSSGYQFNLPELCLDGGCYVGVWSRHNGDIDLACSVETWPYYQLEIGPLRFATAIGNSTWGEVKERE